MAPKTTNVQCGLTSCYSTAGIHPNISTNRQHKHKQKPWKFLRSIQLCYKGKSQLQSLKEVLHCLLLLTRPENTQNREYHKVTCSITWISGICVLIVHLKFFEREGNKKPTKNQSLQHACCLNEKSLNSSKSHPNWYYSYVWNHQERTSSYQKMPYWFSQTNTHVANSYFAYETVTIWKEKLDMLMAFPSSVRKHHWEVYRIINVSHSWLITSLTQLQCAPLGFW